MVGDIRLATSDEAGAIADVVMAAYAPYVPRIGTQPAPMTADYDALIDQGLVYVYSCPSELCGVLVIVPWDDHMLLENIAVRPAWQGRGIGRRLMEFAERQAVDAGSLEIRLYTNERMTENIRYYGRLGYEETERREEDGFLRVFMRKRLNPPESATS